MADFDTYMGRLLNYLAGKGEAPWTLYATSVGNLIDSKFWISHPDTAFYALYCFESLLADPDYGRVELYRFNQCVLKEIRHE